MSTVTSGANIGEWMQSYSGRRLYVRAPRPSDIVIEDIAHHLSMICRFNGAVTRFYSVAEHAVRVSRLVEDLGGTEEEIFWGLNHDDSEYVLGDVTWPLKQTPEMREYKTILEPMWMMAICDALRMPREQPTIVKHADLVMLATEKRDLMSGSAKTIEREAERAKGELGDWHCDHLVPLPRGINPWTQGDAKKAFLGRFAACKPKEKSR